MAEAKFKVTVWRVFARTVIFAAIVGLPFLGAGRLNWLRGWIFVAAMLFTLSVNLLLAGLKNPDVLRARMKPTRPTEPFDRVFVVLYTAAFVALLLVAGLDAGRFGWSPLPWVAIYAGLALHGLGNIPITWSLVINPYLEATVRIQSERGQRVITRGPYRIIRHPMYLGLIVMVSGWPLLLGSLWAYIPMITIAVLVVFRTAFEDRTLKQRLPGYAEYAARTRYRLVPGVW